MGDEFVRRGYEKWQKKYGGDETLPRKLCRNCGDVRCKKYKCWI